MQVNPYEIQDQLFNLIDGCRERGVLMMRLHDGTEFHLDPSWGAPGEPTDFGSPAPVFAQPESLPYPGASATLDRTDPITAELDAALFGKSLDDPKQ